MTPKWVVINRDRNAWKHSMAVECELCGALCVSEQAYEKHLEWHNALAEVAQSQGGVAG